MRFPVANPTDQRSDVLQVSKAGVHDLLEAFDHGRGETNVSSSRQKCDTLAERHDTNRPTAASKGEESLLKVTLRSDFNLACCTFLVRH